MSPEKVATFLKEMRELKSRLRSGDEFTPAPKNAIKCSSDVKQKN